MPEVERKPEKFLAFVTGSQAYGIPHEDSDVDLVVFVSKHDACILMNILAPEYVDKYGGGTSFPLRFGCLNLLVCVDEESYRVWKEGTKILKAKKPVSREEAKKVFASLRKKLVRL